MLLYCFILVLYQLSYFVSQYLNWPTWSIFYLLEGYTMSVFYLVLFYLFFYFFISPPLTSNSLWWACLFCITDTTFILFVSFINIIIIVICFFLLFYCSLASLMEAFCFSTGQTFWVFIFVLGGWVFCSKMNNYYVAMDSQSSSRPFFFYAGQWCSPW